MSVSANCDGCGQNCEDECYCAKCSVDEEAMLGEAGGDVVGDLAAAIRRGDTSEAEYLLDRLVEAVPGWPDRVSIGRYSRQARAA